MATDGPAPTYEGTLEHHALSEGDMQEECSDDFLFWPAKKMARWRGVQLGLDRAVVATIENNGATDDEGKRNQLLERWKEKFGHDATYGRLARSFIESDMANMADIICKERKNMLTRQTGGCKKPPTTPVTPSAMQFTSQLEEKASNTRGEPQTTEVETVSPVHQQVNKSESVTFYSATDGPAPTYEGTLEHHALSEGDMQEECSHSRQNSETEPPNPQPEPTAEEQPNRMPVEARANKEVDIPDITPNPPTNTADAEPHDPTSDSIRSKCVQFWQKVTPLFKYQKKEKTIQEFKQHKQEVQGMLKDKKDRIEKLEQEAHTVQRKLNEEKRKRERAQEDLHEKEQNRRQIQNRIRERDRELHEKLEIAQREKEEAEAKLEATDKRLKELQESMEKNANEQLETSKEKGKIDHMLQWITEHLEEEENELKVMYKLRRLVFMFFFVVLTAIITMVFTVIAMVKYRK